MMMHWRYLVVLMGFAGAASVHAQLEAQLKPGISLETGLGYNTNPYSETESQRAGKSVGDLMLRIAPQFSVTNENKLLALDAAGSANLAWLMGLTDNPGFLVFSGGVVGGGSYNPSARFSLFSRASLQASRSLGELFVGNMTNLTGKLSVGETWRPGGGKLAWTFQGDYQTQGYPGISFGTQTSQPRILNNQSYGLSSRLTWQFLPKTATFLEGRYGFFESVDSNRVDVTTNPVYAGIGLTGRITGKMVASTSVSFSRVLLQEGDASLASTSFPIGFSASVSWNPTSRTGFILGGTRNMTPTPVYLDSVNNNLSLRYEQRLGNKVTLNLSPSFGMFEYGKPVTSLSSTNYRLDSNWVNRVDFFTEAQASLAYAMNEWFDLVLSGDGFWRWTNSNPDGAQILGPSGWVAAGDGSQFSVLFTRYQVSLSVRMVY